MKSRAILARSRFNFLSSGNVKTDVMDASGAIVRSFSSNGRPKKPDTTGNASVDSAMATAVPGAYKVRLIAGVDTMVRAFTVIPDPRLTTTTADCQAQFNLAQMVGKQITALTESVDRIADIQKQTDERTKQAGGLPMADDISKSAGELRKKFEGVRAELYEVYTKADQATLNFPIKLYQMWLPVNAQVLEGDAKPTDQHQAISKDMTSKQAVQLEALARLEAVDLVAFNELLKKAGLPPVYVPPKKPIL